MVAFWIATAVAQCLVLWGLWRGGRRALLGLDLDLAPSQEGPWPRAAMIIPMAGRHPHMPAAVRSLLRQDYPDLLPVLVTATVDDPATALAMELEQEFPRLRRVLAGKASSCGQKNHNLLRGLEAVGKEADIYLFCDSTHTASPDFARRLARPIAEGEAAFATGYHYVDAEDSRITTLGYQLSVLLMRLLQAVSVFTQPWGGAMAVSRRAFERYGLAQFWADKVVDDCSLAGWLQRRRLHVALCPKALLRTEARAHRWDVWRSWMDRQVLFLKFCVPGQWWLLGVFALLLTVPTLWSLLAVCGGLLGAGSVGTLALGSAHLMVLSLALAGWRDLLPRPVRAWPWLRAFAVGAGMFLWVYLRSLPARTILWHGIVYRVGRDGRVTGRK